MFDAVSDAGLLKEIVHHHAAEGVGKDGDGAPVGEEVGVAMGELLELLVEGKAQTVQNL